MTDLAPLFKRIRAVEFPSLPADVQAELLSQPYRSIEVVPEGEGFRAKKISDIDRREPLTLMPKLGVKSWVDTGRLGLIYDDVLLGAVLIPLLQCPTPQQQRIARAWFEADEPLHVHLIPYVDFTAMSEARFWVSPSKCRLVSAKRRGLDTDALESKLPEAKMLARRMAEEMPDDVYLVDIAIPPSGAPRLLEINPGLTPDEAALL